MAIVFFIAGLFLGSFYLVLGLRLPKKEDVIFSRSHCDSCGHTLKWYNLIPIFSYIFQKGKCTYCHQKISPLNIIVELATAVLFMIGYIMYGFSYEFYMYLIITSLMIIIFVSDFNYMIILDSPLVVAIILILILKFVYFGYKEALLGIVNGLLLFAVMYFIQFLGEKIFKRESLGGGDVKFSFIIGLALNFQLGLIVLILSTFLALPYSLSCLYLTKNNEVPYGPFLVGALFIVFVFLDKFQALLNFIFNI